MSVPKHEPVIVTDGGPWAEHDQACPVCRINKAVLDLHYGIFQPCWSCQKVGWMTRCLPGWKGRMATRYGYQDGCPQGEPLDGTPDELHAAIEKEEKDA